MHRLQKLACECLLPAVLPVLTGVFAPLAHGQTPASSVFLQAPTYNAGGGFPSAVVATDVNHDGIADILTAECGASCTGLVGVLLGKGDGTFKASQTYGSGGYVPTGLAVADVNGDGVPDVVVTNTCVDGSSGTCSGNSTVAVLLGNGDGTFGTAQTFDTGAPYASAVAVADVNGDGKLDLLVTNQCTTADDCSGLVTVLPGNGDGTFRAAQHYSAGYSAFSIAVADLNHDGKPDVVVANRVTSSTNFQGAISVLLGRGDGSFQSPQTSASGAIFAHTVLIADLNKDGNPDLAVLHECGADQCGGIGDGSVSILLGNGNGTFQTPQIVDSGGTMAAAMTVADVNGDSKLDLIVANSATAGNTNQYVNGSVAVLLGGGDGTFVLAHTYNSMGWTPHAVAVANLNADGSPDIVVANQALGAFDYSGAPLAVMLGHGDGSFHAAPVYDTGGLLGGAVVSIADLNADGKADLVITNDSCTDLSCNGVIGVKLGNGDGTFSAPQTYKTGGNFPRGVAIADVNGDGTKDILVAIQCADYQTCASLGSNGSVAVLLGQGNGTFGPAQTFDSGGVSASSLVLADTNGDGKLDILVTNQCVNSTDCTSGSVGLLLGNGDGTFQAAVPFSSGGYFANAAVTGDVNGDGVPDLLVANYCLTSACTDNGQVAVLLGQGDGTLAAPVLYDTGSFRAHSLVLQDINGDGVPDIVVANGDSLGVLIGNGDGTFQGSLLTPGVNGYQGQIAVADFDGDGKADIASEAGPLLLGNGDGTFTATTGPLPPGPGIAVGDLNGDNDPDLAIGGVTILLNIAPQAKITPTISWPAPLPISYGTALSATQLDATANAAGTFLYSPAPGAVLAAGAQTLSVTFLPTDTLHYTTATAQVVLVVNQAGTSTTLTSSLNPSFVGQSVTFTATVTGNSPTGTVTFTDGASTIGAAPVTGGSASLTTSALTVGNHSIAASYGGDSNYLGSMSATLQQKVNNLATSSTTLTSSLNPSVAGHAVSFTATVTGLSPTGTVTFTDGASTIGTAPLTTGSASVTTSALTPAVHNIVASYSGDSANFASTSSTLLQTVNPPYTVVDLGTLGGTTSEGLAINSNGQVAGESYIPGGDVLHQHAFLISPPYTTMIDLGTNAGAYSSGSGINNIGQVTGGYDSGSDGAFLLSPPYSSFLDIGSLDGGFSVASGINANGKVTGRSAVVLPRFSIIHAFVWDGTMHDLGALNGAVANSYGYAINASGQVTGSSDVASEEHAFIYSSATGMTDIGTLGGGLGVGAAINDAGQVAGYGWATAGGPEHAFLWDGTMHDLGTLSGGKSDAAGINASGQVVGLSQKDGDYAHAFVYTKATGMVDLNTLLPVGSGWILTVAYAINDAGQITGTAVNPSGLTHAFVLTPPPPPMGATMNGAAVAKPPSGLANAVFTVTFYNAGNQPVAVNFTSVDGTARAGVDYVADSGTLTFAPGVTTQSITVQIIGGKPNAASLFFSVRLTLASDSSLLASGAGTILVPANLTIVYTLSADQASLALMGPSSASTDIILQSQNGVGETAHLTAAWKTGAAPAKGVTFALSSSDVTIPASPINSVSAILTVTTTASPSVGTFTLTVTATSASGVTRSADVSIAVTSSQTSCCVGNYVAGAQGVDINVGNFGISPGSKYQVVDDGGAPPGLANISVKRVSDNRIVLQGTQAAFWGFSPDDDRFVTHSVQEPGGASIDHVVLYDLTRTTPQIWTSDDSTHSSRIQFSPSGRYLFYTDVTAGGTQLKLIDARTGTAEFTPDPIVQAAGAPIEGQDSFGTVGWGFGPDDSRFAYAYVTAQTPQTVVQWNLVNLQKGPGHALVKNITLIGETAEYWQFSPCGDVIGLVHQPGQSGVMVEVYHTTDGTSAGQGAQIASPVQSLQLHATATSEVATNTTAVGSTDYTLGANSATCTTPASPPPPPACRTGNYVVPAQGVDISVGNSGMSPGNKYQVLNDGGAPPGLANIRVRRVSDNMIVLPETQAAFWGFSPDDDRFVTHWVEEPGGASIDHVVLYDLTRTTPKIWTSDDSTQSSRIQFSPSGHYLFYTDVSGGTQLKLVDALTGAAEFTPGAIVQVAGAPIEGQDSFGTAGWGFGPDDSRFVYAYVSAEVPQTVVQWNLVNLGKGPGHALVKSISLIGETAAYWQFSPGGDVIGLVHQPGQSGVMVEVYNTADGTSAGQGAQIPSPVQSLQLHTTATSQVATNTTADGSTDYALGANNAKCTASFGAHSPVNILVVDVQGRRTGFDAATGAVVNEIPGGSYTGIGSEPQTVTIPYVVGTYVMDASGLDSLTLPVPYRLTVGTSDAGSDPIDQHEMSGVAFKGSRQQFVVILGDNGLVMSFSSVGTTSPYQGCSASGNSTVTAIDAQALVNEALGLGSPIHDFSGDGKVNVLDVQMVVNAVLGLGCATP